MVGFLGMTPITVPFLLAEDTAAVFLHVEAQLPGCFPARTEQGPPIPVNKGDAVLFRHGRTGFPDKVVVLVGTDEQGGAEAGKTLFHPITGGFFQPQPVTKGASPVKIRINSLNKGPQSVFILD
jgi:hypothetical protein